MKNLLHIGTVVVLLLVYMLPSPLMASGSTKFYVIDKCDSSNKGTTYPSNQYVASACAGNIYCDSGSSVLWPLIDSSVRTTYSHGCTAAQLYRSSSSSSYGKYVVCFNRDTSSTNYPSCSNFSVSGDISNYCDSEYVGASDLGLKVSTSAMGITIGNEYNIYTGIYTCCKTCGGTSDWSSYSDSIEKANAYSCMAAGHAGTCYAGGTTYYRCKANYYSSTGISSTFASDALGCTECPTNSTSNAGSSNISACKCAANYYNNGTTCAACPAHSTSSSGSANVSACLCDSGYYKNAQFSSTPASARCIKCPGADDYPNVSSRFLTANIEYCRLNKDTNMVDSTGTYSYTIDCYFGRFACSSATVTPSCRNVAGDAALAYDYPLGSEVAPSQACWCKVQSGNITRWWFADVLGVSASSNSGSCGRQCISICNSQWSNSNVKTNVGCN